MNPIGETLTIGTVWLALAGYFVGAAGLTRSRWRRVGCIAWAAGSVLFLAHVAFSFHFYHDWSHASARAAAARDTEALLGTQFGAGVYVSYAFTVVWFLDALWRLVARPAALPLAWSVPVQAFLFFIVVNGTVAFESGPVRWYGVAGCTIVAVAWLTSLRTNPSVASRSGEATP